MKSVQSSLLFLFIIYYSEELFLCVCVCDFNSNINYDDHACLLMSFLWRILVGFFFHVLKMIRIYHNYYHYCYIGGNQ